MAAKWFCKIDDREIGPLLIAQLQRLATKGQLKADTLVRREDSDVWVSATELSELQSLLGAKNSSSPKARQKPVARRLPVAAAVPPAATSPAATSPAAAPPSASPPSPPVASGPGIQIDTHASTTSAGDVAPAAHSTSSEGASRVMLAGLIGLGCVVVVLLVAIVFLIAGNDGSDDEQTADSKQSLTDLAGRDNQKVKADTAGKSPATTTPTKQTGDFSTFSDWRKASSRLGVRNSATKELVCVVGIKSVWASDDPSGGAVESSPAIAASARIDSTKKPVSDDDVLDLSALGVSKKKKRTDITGRIIEPEPEPQPKVTTDEHQPAAAKTKDPSSFRYLFVQVSLKNASADDPLTYLGWNGDGETTQSKDARLWDQDGNQCLFVSRIESPRDDRQEESTIAPQETLIDVLVFELPADGFEHLRLLLPTEAIGQSKHLGYEIKKSDIAFGPAATSASPPAVAPEVAAGGKVPPSKADLEQEIQKLREDLIKPEDDQPDVEQPPPKKRDAKEEFQDLKRLIEAERNEE